MKTINVTFTDAEFRRLQKAKGEHNKKHNTMYSWHKFIISCCCAGLSEKRKGNKIVKYMKGGKNKNDKK